MNKNRKKLGIMIVGLGGAVASTAVAGIELLRRGKIGAEGLPLAPLPENLTGNLADYENIVFGGWDLNADDLATAAAAHDVLTLQQFQEVSEQLQASKPLAAVCNSAFCRNIEGKNVVAAGNHNLCVEIVREDIRRFKNERDVERVVVINLASTESFIDKDSETFATLENFEKDLGENSAKISPAMIYAYAAIGAGAAYGNFTPSVAADIPALVQYAEQKGVPIAGKDGKTGQTFIKTVIAPGLKARALKVDGWYSTNILGNRDGLALSHPDSLKSKITTKNSVLDDILGYKVEDHLVDIRYYRPRGDNKEAWDNIDIIGFLGQPMQLKINFLCRDSILAAPLVIEIARLLDYAQICGEAGVQEQLSVFFKLPQVADETNQKPEHALHLQERMLLEWLTTQAHKTNAKQPQTTAANE
ncbi:MAG TPA: inositol-3-phosphate synthase [Pyrinomonadaceae bacterium]|nr:inositol-3-phosphate synthase [Pyrinomonadaceae bacterium]